MPSGLLLLDKPEGVRSSDCVSRAKAAFGRDARVGHAGTLDSTASGLLVLLVGTATRLSEPVMLLSKVYRAVLHLGRATDTCDYSGQVISQGDFGGLNESDIDRVLPSFWGWRMQRPPEISAIKNEGVPAHKLARAGQEVHLVPRPVLFQSVRRVSPLKEGRVEIETRCGKGTYIRSLARDLGEVLGCGAFVEALRRLSIGPFRVEDAHPLEALSSPPPLLSPWEVVNAFHHIELTPNAEGRFRSGISVSLPLAGRCVPGMTSFPGGEICVAGERLIGFGERGGGRGQPLLLPRTNIVFEEGRASYDSHNRGL